MYVVYERSLGGVNMKDENGYIKKYFNFVIIRKYFIIMS